MKRSIGKLKSWVKENNFYNGIMIHGFQSDKQDLRWVWILYYRFSATFPIKAGVQKGSKFSAGGTTEFLVKLVGIRSNHGQSKEHNHAD